MAELAVEAGDFDGRDDELVVEVVARHAGALLRTARRHSLCADDAHDAYQRALEIFVRRAGRLRRETAVNWLHQVVKHEAMAVREQRQRLVATEEVEPDEHAPTPEDRVVSLDRTQRAAEALSRLKPQEAQALWLKAQGLSYQEIAARQSWTYTKVNRCLTEGRRAFLERYAGIEAGDECRRWAPVVTALVDGEATARQAREVRGHLRHCAGCRSTVRELRASGPSLAGVLPAGAAAAPAALDALPEPGGLLARVYEAVAGGLHERAVGSAMKLQAAAEAAATGKVAAVAASAAAIATGGAVTADQTGVLRERPKSSHVRAERPAAKPQPSRAAGPARAVVRSAAARPGPARQAATGPARRATPRQRAATRAREFGFERPGGAAPQAPARSAPTASAASGGGDATRPARTAPRAASNASPEFGFEAAP